MSDPKAKSGSQVDEGRDRALHFVLERLKDMESIGDSTQPVAEGLASQFADTDEDESQEDLSALREITESLEAEFRSGWSDTSVAHILFSFGEYLKRKDRALPYVAENVACWLASHTGDATKFLLCLDVVPPQGISISRVLNNGAQKQVYVARWPEITPREVAFKVFKDADGESGDAFPHPLRGHHPNIIETFVLHSDEEEPVYLVEALLQTTLSDQWDPRGLGEVVNLIRDIAHALSFVHGFGRIHADIKLDNIGFEAGRYILLDFGLCRPAPTEDRIWTPTGNVRGLAPELLTDRLSNSTASDVWALGSVAYAALTGQPPYFNRHEKNQGFSSSERARTVERLAERVSDPEWEASMARKLKKGAPEYRVRSLVEQMLAVDPSQRPSAQQVFERCNSELGEFLRPVKRTVELPPAAELRDIIYLNEEGDGRLASRATRLAVKNATMRIDAEALEPFEQARLASLTSAL